MRTKRSLTALVAAMVVVLGLSSQLRAQQGQNAVQQGQTNQVAPTNSPAFVDASVFGVDICSAINTVLSNYASLKGVVIDARGVSSLTCSGNPWGGSSSWPVATVLLPAGIIKISATWTLPQGTQIIGEGPNLTILQRCTNEDCWQPGNTDMIDMGNSALCSAGFCYGVVVEHLGLDGQDIAGLNGIVNNWSQELSYVNDVAMINMGGTGLSVGIVSGSYASSNSGPYSDISYTGTGPCVTILGKNPSGNPNNLRGFQSLSCSTSSSPAISLDASNTVVKDVTIAATGSLQDGILVGNNASGFAGGDALLNIRAGSGSGTITNLIHISKNGNGNTPDVSDLSILGASHGSGSVTNTIQDDLTIATLTDASVGMYAIGEPVTTGTAQIGYSRFTTSPNLPSWSSGPNALTQSSACPATATGSLYSCTNSGNCTGTALWGCTSQQWVAIK